MKRAMAFVMALLVIGCFMDKRFLNLKGISFTLIGDIEQAKSLVGYAGKLMFLTEMANAHDLSQVSNMRRLENGAEIKVDINHGMKSATIYSPPPPLPPIIPRPPEVEQLPTTQPALSILMTTTGRPINYLYDLYSETITPQDTGYFYIEKDKKRRVFYYGEEPLWEKQHVRLEHVGTDINQGSQYIIGNRYEHPPPNLLWERDFAYRIMFDPFGNFVNVDPVIFTGPGYVQKTDNICELWENREDEKCATVRATDWYRTYTTRLYVADRVVKSGYSELHRPYSDKTFVKNITIPTDLEGDWPEEMINRVAVPPGTYELWTREDGNFTGDMSGTQYFWEWGEDIEGESLDPGHGGCLFHEFSYSGGGENYKLKVFVATPEEDFEAVVYEINEGDVYGGPDDIWSDDFKLHVVGGRPVYTLGYFRWYYTKPDFSERVQYARYGIWYNGELHMTDPFEIDNINQHPVFGSTEDLEGKELKGYGYTGAFGINRTYQQKIKM